MILDLMENRRKQMQHRRENRQPKRRQRQATQRVPPIRRILPLIRRSTQTAQTAMRPRLICHGDEAADE